MNKAKTVTHLLVPLLSYCSFAVVPLNSQATEGITGKWHVVYATEDGPRETDADLKVNSQQVSGKWGDGNVKGTYKDGVLDLAFPYNSPEANLTSTLKIKAKLAQDKLQGTWEFGEWSGTLEANRPKQ